ncbi:hypothetical protein F442_14736 [Phytophthora nicotianae P10297]|uniref:RxLR effector protein n=1 Tax=Phytophthora nicotianae P10297 TaxID=1317064 RepID=W2YU51_PHYNI|nr:hypothetical protein F442_14736 [Phytophthora nicotianae P10297]
MRNKATSALFKLYKDLLKEDGYRDLRSRKIEVLEDYITLFNREKSADETLLKVLTTGVGDESQIAPILEKARTNSRSVEKANELETALLTKWRGENLSPMTVWSRLKFSDNVDNALSSGKLGMFSKYIAKYYPNNEKSVLERFTVKYGEDAVAKALVTATNKGTMKDFASKLQTQQLEGWLARQKSAGDVFNLLKIKEDGVLSMKSRKVIVLSKYVNLFNGKNPQDKTQLFSVMKNGFGGDGGLARMVTAARRVGDPEIELTAKQYQKGLFKQWFAGDIKPENVYAKFLNGKEGHMEKAIVAQYKAHYDKQMNPQIYTFNDPRRS